MRVPASLPTNYWSSCGDGSYQAEGWFQGTLEEFEECNLPQRMRETVCMRNQRNRNHPLVELVLLLWQFLWVFLVVYTHAHTHYGAQEDRGRTNNMEYLSTWAMSNSYSKGVSASQLFSKTLTGSKPVTALSILKIKTPSLSLNCSGKQIQKQKE